MEDFIIAQFMAIGIAFGVWVILLYAFSESKTKEELKRIKKGQQTKTEERIDIFVFYFFTLIALAVIPFINYLYYFY